MRFREQRFIHKTLGKRGRGGIDAPNRIDVARLRLLTISGEGNEALVHAPFALGVSEIGLNIRRSRGARGQIFIPDVGHKLIERIILTIDRQRKGRLIREDDVENFVLARFVETFANGLLDMRLEFLGLDIIDRRYADRAYIAFRDRSFFVFLVCYLARFANTRVIDD